jgi:DNA-binding response OmpR family regulator
VAPHILLVEDNEWVTSALRVLLESGGYRVTVAGTVAEGLAAGIAEPVNLLLLDLSLPDGDSLHLLEELRRANRQPGATVLLTGHEDTATRDRAISAGCCEVWLKPVPSRELLDGVRRLIS